MITENTVKELLAEHLKDGDIFLVDVLVKPGNQIRVHLDKPEGISIDECVEVSRYLNATLDRDVEDYSLEVSSPGLGSPLKVKQQYEKNVGRTLDVVLKDGDHFNGKLLSVDDAGFLLKAGDRERPIRFDDLKTAKVSISFH
ncbi:MAG: ribosome assembly cofactor RimP [Bacteroidales bacterium]